MPTSDENTFPCRATGDAAMASTSGKTPPLPRTLRAALLAALLACATQAHAADPFTIDVILPLTGGASFLGKAEQQSLLQAEKELATTDGIHGRPVHFAFHDDQSSPQNAVQLATQLVGAHPPVILGSALVGMCNAMAPLMRNGPVLYCFSPGIHPAPGSYVFTSSASTRDLAAVQLRYFRLRGLDRIAIITSSDASGQDAQRNLKDLLALPENKPLQLVAETTFNPTDVSAAAQLQRFKGQNPQALIAWTTGAAVGTVLKAIVDAGLDVPVATTDGNMTYAQMAQYAAFLPRQLYIASPDWLETSHAADPEVAAAKAAFFTAFQGAPSQPDAASTYSWDPAMLVVSGLRALPPGATATALRDYLAHLKGFAGVNGTYDFPATPQRGIDESNVVVTLWNPAHKTWDIVSQPRGVPLQ